MSEAHRAETAGGEPKTRLVEPDQLRRPHLVLPHVGSDDGPATREPVDLGHQVLRLDLGIGRRRLERMLLFPLPDAMPPGPPGRPQRFIGRILVLRQQFVQPAEDAFDIAHDGHVGRAVLADFRGVDIHVDDLGVRRKCRQAPGNAVVEPHAQGDQQVAFGQSHVGRVAAVHTRHADEIGVLRRQAAQTHQGEHGRRIGQLHELAQFFRRTRRNDAAAAINQRPLGFLDQLRRAANLAGVAFGEDPVAGQVNRRHL